MTNRIVDQFHDPAFGGLVRNLQNMPALEDFVKEASIETYEEGTLPDTSFAWSSERRFPIHTPHHAALSYAYSKTAGFLPPFVEDAIKAALDVYGVPLEIFTVKEAAVEPEPPYLLPAQKLMPIKTAEDVKFAQTQLLGQVRKLDLEHRAIAFTNLVKQAELHKVALHPGVLKFAGLVVSDYAKVATWLEARAAALPLSAKVAKAAYEKLAAGVAKRGEGKNRQENLKLAEAIQVLDEQTGLDREYDRRLPDPLQTVFNTEKLAEDSIDLGNGKMFSLAKMAALPLSFWEDLAGPEFVHEVAPGGKMDNEKLAVVIPTLPLDLKVVLRSQLRA